MKLYDADEVFNIILKYSNYMYAQNTKMFSNLIDEIAKLKGVEQEPQESEDEE